MRKVHYYHGCPWADGELQSADTNQTDNWDEVTCFQCLRLKATNYGKRFRKQSMGWDAEKGCFKS